jgi:hypothetical protein
MTIFIRFHQSSLHCEEHCFATENARKECKGSPPLRATKILLPTS